MHIFILDHRSLCAEHPFYECAPSGGEPPPSKKWADLHGVNINCGTTEGRPKLGALYFHTKMALRRAQAFGWLQHWPTGWAVPAMPPVERYMVDDERIRQWASRAASSHATPEAARSPAVSSPSTSLGGGDEATGSGPGEGASYG